MEPLNAAERTKAFLKFTAVFIVTVGLVFAVIFVGSTIPGTEIQKLKDENQRLSDLNAHSSLQYMLVDSISRNIVRYDTDTNRLVLIEQEINSCVIQLTSIVKSDSSINVGITRDATVAYLNLLDAKKKLKDCGNSSSIIAGLKQQVAETQKKLDDFNKEMYMTIKSQGQGGSH